MHLVKGLEFRAVAVMACDDEIVPSQKRIENVADDPGLDRLSFGIRVKPPAGE
jgi:superfamily I DNA/RNA helicase